MWKLLVVLLVYKTNAKCYWNNKCPYRLFGTKTPYEAVRGDVRDIPALEQCEPVSVWMMMRHGTRHPEVDEITQMKAVVELRTDILQAHEEGRGEMCAQDIQNLRKWTWDKNLDASPSDLTVEGMEELQSIGSRFGEKFSNVLEHMQQYKIRASIEMRTQMSAKAFVKGLQRNNQTLNISTSFPNDLTARPYRYCKRRFYDILIGDKIPEETAKYLQSRDFLKVLTSVQKRTGLTNALSPKTILQIYDLCRFYRSYSIRLSDAWCALFSDSDLKALEYVEDVQHYYRNGHGEPMNAKLGASSLKDLYQKFVQGTQGINSFSGYFSHDTMLGMLYAALGIYADTPVISGFERVKKRQWRTSFLTPYAANFVAVLNRCNDSTSSVFKVQFLINEMELHLCNKRACDWDEFVKQFEPFTRNDLSFCNETRLIS
ncbi:multiple inositol polyphosphate phosphatase 1-like [Colias croceus]|uniref:multiple inositol polyphosphate phosphatase 1-like n=1 Tax=Colias crocea TaxID=72248 RepID=UPI001E280255|nr:multiple inositol polyphosphate phosphatase 1-like [Colias croceus]